MEAAWIRRHLISFLFPNSGWNSHCRVRGEGFRFSSGGFRLSFPERFLTTTLFTLCNKGLHCFVDKSRVALTVFSELLRAR